MGLDVIRVAVCDDHKTELLILKKLLEHYCAERPYCNLQISYFSESQALLAAIGGGMNCDLCLLDIMMPGMDGITLGRRIRESAIGCALIYITASDHYALDAFQVRASHYLVKPIDGKQLFAALDEVIGRIFVRAISGEQFLLKTREGITHIPLDTIVHAENIGRAVRVYLNDGSFLESVVSNRSFDEQVEPLLRHPDFIRTHKSYVVNIRRAVTLLDGEIELLTGRRVPVSRRHYANVHDLFVYMFQKTE